MRLPRLSSLPHPSRPGLVALAAAGAAGVAGVLPACSSPDSPSSSPGRPPAHQAAPQCPQNPTAEWSHDAALVRAAGGSVCPNTRPTLLAFRASDTAGAVGYRDAVVLLRPDGTVSHFQGSTEPRAGTSPNSRDANGDGQPDVGMLRPGFYLAVANGPYVGAPSYHVETRQGSDAVPGWRDTNHDGIFSPAEKQASEARGDTLGAILWHQGHPWGPNSAGCQNFAPADAQRFVQDVGGPGGSFDYVLEPPGTR